jgi:hypothetical protein
LFSTLFILKYTSMKIPFSEFASRNVVYGLIGLGAIGLAAGLANNDAARATAYHHFEGETGTEKLISNAISQAVGTTILVECVNEPRHVEGRAIRWQAFGLYKNTAYVTLDEVVCKELQLVHDHPAQYGQNVHIAAAVEDAAHEGSHHAGKGHPDVFETREGVTECYGVQRTALVAEGLGLSRGQAETVANVEAQIYEAPNARYAPPADCISGSQWDLDTAHAHAFPNIPTDYVHLARTDWLWPPLPAA